MAIILFPFLYNLKSRLLGEKSYIRVDMRKFFIILVFGLVLVIGSDRLILRVCYYFILTSAACSALPGASWHGVLDYAVSYSSQFRVRGL